MAFMALLQNIITRLDVIGNGVIFPQIILLTLLPVAVPRGGMHTPLPPDLRTYFFLLVKPIFFWVKV